MPNHYCCVPKCNSLNKRDPVKFFKFPATEKLRRKWILKIGRGPKFIVTKNTRICSKHFETGRRSYCPDKTDYIPSIFPFIVPRNGTNNVCSACRRKEKSCKCPTDEPMSEASATISTNADEANDAVHLEDRNYGKV